MFNSNKVGSCDDSSDTRYDKQNSWTFEDIWLDNMGGGGWGSIYIYISSRNLILNSGETSIKKTFPIEVYVLCITAFLNSK